MNAWTCAAISTELGVMIFESNDDDNWDRSLQPIIMEMEGTE
jgi:hypothetical protein